MLKGGVLRRYHVFNDPMFLTDPGGLQVESDISRLLKGMEFGFRAAGVVFLEVKIAAGQQVAKALASEFIFSKLPLSNKAVFIIDKSYAFGTLSYEIKASEEMAKRIARKLEEIKLDVFCGD